MGEGGGFKVRLALRGESKTDDSFWYFGDSLPHEGQVIEITSEYHADRQARVDRVTPDDDPEIHATEFEA